MANRDLDVLPERSVVMVRAFAPRLNRAVVVGGIASALLVSALTLIGLTDRTEPSLGPIVIAAISALVGLAIGIASVSPRIRRAFEAYSWLGHAEVARFRERTGDPVPTKRAAMLDWLATNPSTPTMRLPRIELLAFVGRYDEARAELAQAASTDVPTTPEVAFELASLSQYIDWIEHGSTDLTALREAATRLPADSESRLAAEVTIAVAAARPLAHRADAGWTAPLEAVRPRLGSDPRRATLRDTWLPIWVMYVFVGFIAWLAAAVLRSVL